MGILKNNLFNRFFIHSMLFMMPLYSYCNTEGDTSYIVIDKLSINKKEKTYEYMLIFKYKGDFFDIYRVGNRDYGVEFQYVTTYKNSNLNYSYYRIYDNPTGATWCVFYDKNNAFFYESETYDYSGDGNVIIKKSVNFKDGTFLIKTFDNKVQKKKMKKIWQNTIDFRKKTLLLNNKDRFINTNKNGYKW